MQTKYRSKKFWFSLVGAVVMLLNVLGIKINAPFVNEVLNAVCAVLIVIGLLDEPKTEENLTETTEEDGEKSDEQTNEENV